MVNAILFESDISLFGVKQSAEKHRNILKFNKHRIIEIEIAKHKRKKERREEFN